MRMPVPFNTHEVIQELQDLGFPTAQAEGLTAVLLKAAALNQEQLATKLDLAELKSELKGDIAAVRTDMEKMRGDLRTEIQAMGNKVLLWTIGVLGSIYVVGMVLMYNLLSRPLRP
jgi:hypothetical protein